VPRALIWLQRVTTVKLSLGTHIVVDAFHVLVFVSWCTAANVLRRRVLHLLKHRSVRISIGKSKERVRHSIRRGEKL